VEKQVATLERQIETLRKQIASVDAKWPLGQIATETLNRSGRQKRPKGENLRAVRAYLESKPDGATVAEIARAIDVGATSVAAVLHRHESDFSKGQNGLWRMGR